ncbi:MAG: FmdB family transcriptional regulator [Syntrophus sp. (in: bacteria)]|nr:FmdB family transcriptional regulator [Syntrophus sp. (in: bacteria)]
MPIYEYKCGKCGNEFEVIVFGNDMPACPACGNGMPEKKMSTFGFSMGQKFRSSTNTGSGCAGCSSSNCSSCHN